MSPYAEQLTATKQRYPFERWRRYWTAPDEQESCRAVEQAFDLLIARLIELGPAAAEPEKLACFEQAILTTNDHEDIIETGEREDLCELTNAVALACGLDPAAYGDGEGPASEWRSW